MMQGNDAPVNPGELSFPTPKVRSHSLPGSSISSLDQELPMGMEGSGEESGVGGGEEVEVTCWRKDRKDGEAVKQ